MNSYYVTLDVDGSQRGHHVYAKSYDEAAAVAETCVRYLDDKTVNVFTVSLQLLKQSILPDEGAK